MSFNITNITDIKDISQIIFFIVIGLIALLTYLKAKKTILQPIKTEIFKEQLKELSIIIQLFHGKSEFYLKKDFALDKLLSINTLYLLDEYVNCFFDVEIDIEKRPYYTDCPEKLATEEVLFSDNGYFKRENIKIKKPDLKTKSEIWAEYEFNLVHLPKEHTLKKAEFERIISSPLLPKKCIHLLESYLSIIQNNISILMHVLTECAKELPIKYPNRKAFNKGKFTWIHNRYNEKSKPLENKATEIIHYIRDYFDIEGLLET